MKNELISHKDDEQKLRRELEFARIASLGDIREWVYMLSHEMSQPLMVISAYVSGCIGRMEKNEYDIVQIIDAMKAVNKQVERAGRLIHSMKDCVDAIELRNAQIHYPVSIQYEFAKVSFKFVLPTMQVY